MLNSLLAILVCLVLAFVLSDLFKRLGLPRVVGQIIAGLILSIGIIKTNVFNTDSLDIIAFLANLGVILLFYYVGLETNFRAFTKNLKQSVMISIFNTSIPLIAGFAVMRYILGFNNITSLIIGASLSVSAQSVSLDIIEELKILKSKIGSLVITAGAVDDVIELIIISVLLSIFHSAIVHASVSRLLIEMTIFVAVMIAARLYAVPLVLKIFDKEHSSTSRFMGSIIIVIAVASLAELLGFGLFIGAMIAGIIVRQTIFKDVTIPNWEEHDIAKSTHIIAFGFLIPIFFVWVGMNTDLSSLLQNAGLTIILIIIAIAGTVGGTILAVLADKKSYKEGLVLGWGLNPKGDVELVIISLALQYAIITQDVYTSLVFMSLFTTIISPIMFRRLLIKHHMKTEKKSKGKR